MLKLRRVPVDAAVVSLFLKVRERGWKRSVLDPSVRFAIFSYPRPIEKQPTALSRNALLSGRTSRFLLPNAVDVLQYLLYFRFAETIPAGVRSGLFREYYGQQPDETWAPTCD